MLVLSRRKNDSVVINDKITVTVVEIRGDKVRLAISCPAEVPVHRKEVHDAIHSPRSPEETSFLHAVVDDPDDEAIRLIFADWLEERGDPRGEFIRTQCELAKLPTGDRRRPALLERERDLWQRHGDDWRAYLPQVLRSAPFERGFVESVFLTPAFFLDNAEEIFAAAPVRHLRVQRAWSAHPRATVLALATSRHLARLAGLDLCNQDLGDGEARLLAISPHMGSLRSLVLRVNGIGDAGAAALAGSPLLAGLKNLDLAYNRVGEGGARCLAASPHMMGLRRLDLTGNPISVDGTRALGERFGGRVCF
jgi:uncharacterized protein (TIGR02996 family)